MDSLVLSTTTAIAALAAFTIFVSALRYAVSDSFARTRLSMTAFFCFIVVTLTMAFWRYTFDSLPFVAPAFALGLIVGHFVGVKKAQERLMLEGFEHYLEHFAHVDIFDARSLRWWPLINFYSIAGALILINFVGLSNVIFAGRESWALAACAVGAFLLGTIAPYLIHLWAINPAQNKSSTTSEA